MSIREHAEKIVSEYHEVSNADFGDINRLVDKICSLAIATYNKGIDKATEANKELGENQ